jgi:hypothetical protein
MKLRSAVLPFLAPLLAGLAACSSPTGDSSATSAADLTNATAYTAEARFDLSADVTARPVRRLRAAVKLAEDTVSSSVAANHVTTSDKGGFQHDSCTTTIEFPAATVDFQVVDEASGRVLSSYTRNVSVSAGFESPTDPGTTCYPHQYPDLAQTSSLYVTPDDIAFDDGASIREISFSLEIGMKAVRHGDTWQLTSLTLDPYTYANLNHSASYLLPVTGRLAFTSVYEAGKRTPHSVKGHIDIASCTLTDSFGDVGDPEPATFHFAVDYPRALEAGARVSVKSKPFLGFGTSQPGWNDTLVPLTRSGGVWSGEVAITGRARPVKGYPNANERDAVSEADSPTALDYVFRIDHADGTVEWDNGSGAPSGSYQTTGDPGGRYGYYGLVLPASCDGLGRFGSLDNEVTVQAQ